MYEDPCEASMAEWTTSGMANSHSVMGGDVYKA
jgi:hypothetical protein